jgi:hypothetical protein
MNPIFTIMKNSESEDEQNELQSIYNKLFVKYSKLRDLNKHHLKRLNEFEIEISKLIEKVKCLEDELSESQSHLKKFSNDKLVQMLNDQKCHFDKFGLGFDKFATSSHDASTSRTMFVKPEISKPHVACLDKGKSVIGHEHVKVESEIPVKKQSKSILTCFHCGIIGHT